MLRMKSFLLLLFVLSIASVVCGQDLDTIRINSMSELQGGPKKIPYADSVPLPAMGVYNRETIPSKTRPVPYPYIREADVLWSKIIWRVIDLRQKINFPLYYPTQRMRDRKSLAQTLYDAIMEKKIYAYDPLVSMIPGDEFVARMTPDEARERICGPPQEVQGTNEETGRPALYIIPAELKWDEIKRILVKEEWFFDTKHSVLQCRVIGLCPVREEEDPETNTTKARLTFWVYYPEAREVLSKEAFFNPKNDAQVSSFDDLFFKRRFGSYIIRESNEYNNRAISDYKVGGIPNMQESDRVHNDLFNREHDLWEY